MKKIIYKTSLVFLAVAFILSSYIPSGFAQDVEETVKAQIEYTKQRMSQHKQELSSILSQFAKNPSPELYVRIQELQRNVGKEVNILNSLNVALKDARASKSWWSMVEDMSKESALISAGASVVSGVYDAGKWIFGASQEDIYGDNWQAVESFNSKLVNEAHAIREESRSIVSGLNQIESVINQGGSPDALNKLRDDMIRRLNELKQRQELVRKNIRFLIRVYRAEKENLPASTIFWGEDYMGRYVKAMVANVNIGNLIDYTWDLLKGDMVKPLAKFIKPMVQVAIGDYLAKSRGGNNLTPQIIDDLTFSILFNPGGKSVEKFAYDKMKSEATTKLLKTTAQGIIEVEAQVVYATAQKTAWEITKKEIANLPVNADFTNQSALLVKSTDNLAKQTANTIQYNALNKLDKAVKTGKIIKNIWDVVLKDAIQVYLVSDDFTATVKAANEACAGYRQQWQKDKDDMILTENEYVNSKWFSSGKAASAQAPKGAVDPLQQKREELAKINPETTAKIYTEFEDAIETYGGKAGKPAEDPGNMGLAQLEQIEKQMFQAVLDGQMPAEKITLPNIYNLTSKKMYTPCYDETRRLNKAFNISWPEEKCRFREEIAACNASANCRKQNMADPGRWWKKQDKCRNDRAKAYEQQVSKPTQECLKNVNEQYKQYVDRRAQNINKVYKMLEEKYTKMLEEAKGIAGPAINWTQSYEVEFKELLELTENKELMYSSGIDLTRLQAPPDLPGSMGFGGSNVTAQAYDSTKIKNVISSMNKALAMIKGINFDKLNTPIEKADFSIEEIGGFFNENPWLKIYDSNGRPVAVPVVYKTAKPSEAAEKLMFGTGPGTSTGIGAAASLVTLSDPKEVATEEERKTFFKALMQRNPNIYQEYLDKLLAIPLVTNRNYYKTLTNFSPDKAYSLYKEALADYNNTVNQANEVNKRFAEAEQVYRQASSVGEICSFYDNNFKRWQLMRKTSPSAAAKLLNQDSDRFEETVNQYEKKMELARSQIVLPDVGSIRREIDRFNDYAKAYRVSFEKYYAYLAEYFKDKEYPLFDMPDVSQQKMRANNIQIFSDEYSSNFKKAADGLKEMKAAATEFKNTDKTYIIAISQANSQKAKLVNDFIAFYKSNPDKIDTCLKKLEETRKAVLDIAIPADYQYDHQMPKSVRDTALRQRYDDSLSKLIPIEEELQKKKKQKASSAAFKDYQIQNARLNTNSLASASGEVTLLKSDLKQGKIEVQGWFPHLEGAAKILFSEDGGRTWRELAINQMFTASFVPMPNKLYEPLIKIKTEDSEEFQIKVFPNIRGILFKDIDYNQLVAETIGKIAEAYESANFSQFSQYISKDYLGNKTFLEEGIRTDFDLFSNIRLTLYINRIDKRGNIFAAETRWDKTQTPRSTGQEQRTSGNTTFMFVFEDGLMKIQNLRGNLIYATLQPEIAQASGLPQTVVNQIREANQERNPVQPGAGETEQAGGTSTQATIPVKNGSIHSQYATAGDCTSFRTDFDYDFSSGTEGSAGGGDFYLEWNILFNLGGAQIQQITSSTFEALNEAPTSGYTNSSAGTLAAGEVYAFITQEGYYGKFKVTSKNTVDCNRNTVNFSYAVQTDGTRNLKTQ